MPFGRGWGRRFKGRRGNKGHGPGEPPQNCICPNCGNKVPHTPGLPCYKKKCPKCNFPMTREFS